MKVIINFIYELIFPKFLKYIIKSNEKARTYLGYCQNGCENYYARKCTARNQERRTKQ